MAPLCHCIEPETDHPDLGRARGHLLSPALPAQSYKKDHVLGPIYMIQKYEEGYFYNI